MPVLPRPRKDTKTSTKHLPVAGAARRPPQPQPTTFGISRGLYGLSSVVACLVISLPVYWFSHDSVSAFNQVRAVQRLNVSANASNAWNVFFSEYHGKYPVVFEGMLDMWPAMHWSPNRIVELCPDARLPVYSYDSKAKSWASLLESGELALAEYLAQFNLGSASNKTLLYGLEMSLRTECPRLLEDVQIPGFFADDMLVRYYKKAAWPTLIAGPRGTRSGLHKDTHDLPFWMALFSGKKRWRIFKPEDRALENHFKPEINGYAFDPFSPDWRKYPGIEKAEVYEHILEKGQLLYIPNGAAHGAQNLLDTIAISGNYLDPQSLGLHRNRTCQKHLWQDSKLCWFYDFDFDNHKPADLGNVRELSYYEYAGFGGPTEWCKVFLSDLTERSRVRHELFRPLAIVTKYCDDLKGRL